MPSLYVLIVSQVSLINLLPNKLFIVECSRSCGCKSEEPLITPPKPGISVLYIRRSFVILVLAQLKQQALLGGSCRRAQNNYTKRILNLILNRKKFFRQENEALDKQKTAANAAVLN